MGLFHWGLCHPEISGATWGPTYISGRALKKLPLLHGFPCPTSATNSAGRVWSTSWTKKLWLKWWNSRPSLPIWKQKNASQTWKKTLPQMLGWTFYKKTLDISPPDLVCWIWWLNLRGNWCHGNLLGDPSQCQPPPKKSGHLQGLLTFMIPW